MELRLLRASPLIQRVRDRTTSNQPSDRIAVMQNAAHAAVVDAAPGLVEWIVVPALPLDVRVTSTCRLASS